MTLSLCVKEVMPVPQSVGWLVCQSIAQMSKPRKTANPDVNLYSCNLPTFIHFHSPSFTSIHLHSFSFTFYFHPFMQAFIKNVHSSKTFINAFLVSQAFFSVEKNNIDSTNKAEIPVSHFKTPEGKDKQKDQYLCLAI